jgi:RteC protein
MNANFEETTNLLYESLVLDINAILQQDSPDTQKMESCFRCGIDHWNRLKAKIKSEGFASDGEEIHFFKDNKPRFTGEIEYYTQRYHALLFFPASDKETQQLFWEGELSRIDKFFASFHLFFHYYKQGKTDQDSRYFLRRNSDGTNLAHANVFDMDPQTSTSHDWLITNLIGYEKYRKFVLAEMEKG